MMATCLSCHVKSNGMIAIHQHPNGLDEMFFSITGIEVEPNDHLCVPCYDALKSAHQFKQRCIQNNVIRLAGQASKPPALSTTNQNPDSNGNGPIPCGDMRHVPEVEKSNVKLEELQQTQPKDCTEKDSQQEEPTEYIIDLDIVPTDEQIELEEREKDFPLENQHSDEEENDNCSTAIVPCEDIIQQHSSSKSEATNADGERGDIKKLSPRLPRVHSLMCEYCFKEFKSLADKIGHSETHQSEQKPFLCFHEGCSSTFKDRVGLRAHVRIHEVVKRFGCRYCSMRFHTRGNRNAHERTHNGEKPFLCPHCGKGFAEGGNLKNHIRFHTGERPYPCTICEKSYRTHYSRAVHMRSHTNDRPFVCLVCEKGFFSSGKLTIHRRIHTGEKPYVCASCDARFLDRCGLRRHQTKAH